MNSNCGFGAAAYVRNISNPSESFLTDICYTYTVSLTKQKYVAEQKTILKGLVCFETGVTIQFVGAILNCDWNFPINSWDGKHRNLFDGRKFRIDF